MKFISTFFDSMKASSLNLEKKDDLIFFNGNVVKPMNDEDEGVEYNFIKKFTGKCRKYFITIPENAAFYRDTDSNVSSLNHEYYLKLIFIENLETRKVKTLKLNEKRITIHNIVFSDNLIIIIYNNETVQFFTPFRDYIYNLIGSIEYYMPDIFQEMMKKSVYLSKKDEKDNEIVKLRLLDSTKEIEKKKLYSLESEYINNLMENLEKDEFLEEFCDLTDEQFELLFVSKWRSNEAILVSKLSKISSVYFNHRVSYVHFTDVWSFSTKFSILHSLMFRDKIKPFLKLKF